MIVRTCTIVVLLLAWAAIASTARAQSEGAAVGQCLPHCLGDTTGNGMVNVSDLTDVILQWGPCPPGPCSGDTNGDGSVNVTDLVDVIANWGVCATAANDLCADARRVWPQELVSFCTDGANTDGPSHTNCEAKSDDQIHRDLWYHFVAPADGVMSLNTVAVDFDTRLAVYNRILTTACGCPGTSGVLMLACNDDIGLFNERSRINLAVGGGNCYTIRAGGYDGAFGQATMEVDWDWAIPINSTCGTSCVEVHNGTNVGFSGPGDDTSCGYNDQIDEWFRYTVNCSTIPLFTEISTCYPETNFDTTLAVFEVTLNGLVQLACNDDASGCGTGSRILLNNLSETQVYYIRVSGVNEAVGNYKMTINTQCVPG